MRAGGWSGVERREATAGSTPPRERKRTPRARRTTCSTAAVKTTEVTRARPHAAGAALLGSMRNRQLGSAAGISQRAARPASSARIPSDSHWSRPQQPARVLAPARRTALEEEDVGRLNRHSGSCRILPRLEKRWHRARTLIHHPSTPTQPQTQPQPQRRTRRRASAWATRSRRVHRGWLSPPQLSRDIARRGGPLLLVLFSRPFAGRRPRLASSLRSPLRAERGRGARGAMGDTRATRAARVHRRWFSPPQLSRDIARRWSSPPRPLLSSLRRSSSSSRVFSSVAAPC